MKIACVIVTYHPNMDQLRLTIDRILRILDCIIIVDNSECFTEELRSLNDPRCIVLDCGGNTGIANGLNIGYHKAIDLGYDWVLSLDQDSTPPTNIIFEYTKYIETYSHQRIGALVPSFTVCPTASIISKRDVGPTWEYMTSGSLVNLNAFQVIKGFDEKLFIDYVDTDYGFRLIENTYEIIRVPEVILQHWIGNATELKFFGKHIRFITHHNYIRRYYNTRNTLYISKKYGSKFKYYKYPYYNIIRAIVRLIFFEKDKIRKINSIVRGIKDYKNNRYGKYEG